MNNVDLPFFRWLASATMQGRSKRVQQQPHPFDRPTMSLLCIGGTTTTTNHHFSHLLKACLVWLLVASMLSRTLLVGALAVSQGFPSSTSSTNRRTPNSSSLGSSSTHLYSTTTSSSGTTSQTTSTCLSASADDTGDQTPDTFSQSKLPPPPPPSSSSSLSTLSTPPLATSPLSFTLDNYHLLWSPHAWKKLLGTVVVASILPQRFLHLPSTSVLLQRIPPPATALLGNLLLPLAASSCCLLQLGLNALSVGCAGWNTTLGPIRPYFMGLLMTLSFRRPPSSLSTLAWRSAVALLPEMVFLHNAWRQSRTTAKAREATDTTHLTTTSTTTTVSNTSPPTQYLIELEIPTMGCVACINAIDGRLRNVPGVLHVQSGLKPLGQKGGTAAVWVALPTEEDGPTAMVTKLIDTIAEAGFEQAVLTSMRRKSSPSE